MTDPKTTDEKLICGCGNIASIFKNCGMFFIKCNKCKIRTRSYLKEPRAIAAFRKATRFGQRWIPIEEAPREEGIYFVKNVKDGGLAFAYYKRGGHGYLGNKWLIIYTIRNIFGFSHWAEITLPAEGE